MKYDLVSIGNAPVDAIVKVDTSFLEKFGMEEGALTVINAETRDEMLRALGGQKIDFIPGGGSANVVSVLCSAGGKGAFQGRVGDDDNGELFIQSLKDQFVETSSVYKDPDHGTALIVIPITSDGERSFAAYYGAAGRLGPDNVDPLQIKQSKGLYVEGFGLISPHAFDAYKKAIESVRAGGGKVFFGVSDRTVIEGYKDEVAYLMNAADMLFMNRVEAETLTGEKDMDDILKAMLARGLSAVITRGEDGVYVLNGDEGSATFYNVEKRLEGDQVVNMNGAGDAFTGGFLYGMLNGFPMQKAARLGARCARQIIQTPGPRPLKRMVDLV